MTSVYCQEAKHRVAQQGASTIVAFLDEIPSSLRMKEAERLPPVTGFRKGSPLELKERVKKLVTTLTHTTDSRFRLDGPEWRVFGTMWAIWGRHHFNESFELPADPPGESGPEVAESFLRQLIENCGDDGCAQEDIEKLYLFSGFPDSAEASKIVQGQPTRAELEQKRKLSRLPNDVSELKQRLEIQEKNIGGIKKDAENAGKLLFAVEKQGEQIELQVGHLTKDLETLRDTLLASSNETAESVKTLAEEVSRVKGPIASHTKQLEALKATSNELSQQFNEVTKLIVAVEHSLKELNEHVALKFQEIAEQHRTGALSPPFPGDSNHRPASGLRIVSGKTNLPLALIDNVKSGISILSENFVASGIGKTDADDIAKITFAGVLTGQLLQFSGSLAEVLADAVCHAFGGMNYLTWQIPIGLCDSNEASYALERMRVEKPVPQCLLLKGVNKSAFEIYGDEIRELVVRRQLGCKDDFEYRLLMGTWVEGPAAIPGGAPLLNLGPLIDTDKLKWGQPKWDKLRQGEFKSGGPSQLSVDKPNQQDVSDILDAIDMFGLPSTQFRGRLLKRAVTVLSGLLGDDSPQVAQLALTGWVLPWATAHHVHRDDIEEKVRKAIPEAIESELVARALADLPEEIGQ